MTVHTQVEISCDAPGCDEAYIREDTNSRSLAEREAEQRGWLLTEAGQDYCPPHAITVEPS